MPAAIRPCVASSAGSPTTATSSMPLDREMSRPTAIGEAGRVAGEVRRHGRDRRVGRLAVAAPPRSAPPAAAARRGHREPAGVALSWTSFGRVTSASWSSAVSKKPPAGSTKWSRIARRDRAQRGTSARRTSPRTARAVRRRDPRSPRGRPRRSTARPSTIDRAGRRAGGARPEARRRHAPRRPRSAARRPPDPRARRAPRSRARSTPRVPCRRGPVGDAPDAGRADAPGHSRGADSRPRLAASELTRRQDRPALPVAVVGDVVRGGEGRRVVAEDLADLGRASR